jgi:hypothetical protein
MYAATVKATKETGTTSIIMKNVIRMQKLAFEQSGYGV